MRRSSFAGLAPAAALVLVAALGAPGAATAGFPVSQTVKCAVGGESFSHVETASYSTWGARPDGKPYGSWRFPLAPPVCPGNQLIMYRDFDRAERARLKTLLADPAYRALAAEAVHYRAAWLERRLAPSSDAIPELLLQASWDSDDDPPRRARYQAEFVAAVDAAPATGPATAQTLGLRLRAANAERELGRFDAAVARLAGLDFAPAGEDAEGMKGFAAALKAVAARKDASAEPLDMVPPRVVAFACIDDRMLNGTPPPPEACAAEPVAGLVARIKAARAAEP